MPAITVVVPTVDRVDLLRRTLDGLARSTLTDFEVVVVHDGDAGVVTLLDEFRAALPLRPQRAGARDAVTKRNAGWRAAESPLIAFTDDDCEPSPGWLAAVVDAFAREPEADLVQGPTRPHPADADVTGTFRRTIDVLDHDITYPCANVSYRRSALERVDGFDPRVWGGGEDTDLAWRVLESGGRAVFAPDALVWHAVRAVSLRAHLRSLPRWATLPLVLRRHPQLHALIPHGRFWKRSHLTGSVAFAALALTLLDRRAIVGVVPHIAWRVHESGSDDLAALVTADLAEVAVVVAGSIRYRTLLL